jgi:predicted HAD superfamily phosphohydrolase YqeG
MEKLNPAYLAIVELFLQEAKESKVTWAQRRHVRWVFSASKPSTVKFDDCHSAIMTTGIIHVHKTVTPG